MGFGARLGIGKGSLRKFERIEGFEQRVQACDLKDVLHAPGRVHEFQIAPLPLGGSHTTDEDGRTGAADIIHIGKVYDQPVAARVDQFMYLVSKLIGSVSQNDPALQGKDANPLESVFLNLQRYRTLTSIFQGTLLHLPTP